MKIAYVCADPGVPVYGAKGCSIHVQEIVRALIRLGTHVELFAVRTGTAAPPGLEACPLHRLPCPKDPCAAAREQALMRVNEAIEAGLGTRTFDLVYERYSLWSHGAADWARGRGVPYVLEVNAPLVDEQERYRQLHDRQTALDVARRVFHAARAVVCVSAPVARYVESFGVPADRVHEIPNAVDPAHFPGDLRPSVDSAGRFVVGFVGTLKAWHGLDVLLRGFAMLRQRRADAHLLIVGDGPLRDALQRQVAQLHLDSFVRFTGAVPPQSVPGLIRSMDVAVAPYPPMEECYFSPLKVFEYMAAGVSVVASEIGQVSEIVRHGQTGCLVPPGDAAALAETLAGLANDPPLRTRLGDAARNWVLTHHTWERTAHRILALVNLSSDHPEVSAAACS